MQWIHLSKGICPCLIRAPDLPRIRIWAGRRGRPLGALMKWRGASSPCGRAGCPQRPGRRGARRRRRSPWRRGRRRCGRRPPPPGSPRCAATTTSPANRRRGGGLGFWIRTAPTTATRKTKTSGVENAAKEREVVCQRRALLDVMRGPLAVNSTTFVQGFSWSSVKRYSWLLTFSFYFWSAWVECSLINLKITNVLCF